MLILLYFYNGVFFLAFVVALSMSTFRINLVLIDPWPYAYPVNGINQNVNKHNIPTFPYYRKIFSLSFHYFISLSYNVHYYRIELLILLISKLKNTRHYTVYMPDIPLVFTLVC